MEKLNIIKAKILDLDQIRRQCAVWKFKNKKIIFTNGCFDILHLGHIEYLANAASLGGALVVGLNTDSSVRKIKGIRRPINDENSRAMVLASLSFVDGVVLFDEETPYELINLVKPDILVKGNDYRPEEIVGYDILKQYGGEVITLELTPGYSTTSIEEKILHAYKL
jgi:D-glycero-beta-D-manno-heptose 1-phosphate adenylyltransferase